MKVCDTCGRVGGRYSGPQSETCVPHDNAGLRRLFGTLCPGMLVWLSERRTTRYARQKHALWMLFGQRTGEDFQQAVRALGVAYAKGENGK